MDLVGTAAGAAVRKHSNEDGLRPAEWKPLFDMEGRWMQTVLVQFESEGALRAAHRQASGRGINIDGFQAALEIQSMHLDLEGQVANVGRS